LRLGHLPDDRWLACLPLHAVGGLSILFRATLGATTVDLRPRFVAADVADALANGGCALVSLVPSMLADTLDALAGRAVSPTVRAVLVGGAPTPPALVERARALGVPLALTWGMTETASQACTWAPGGFDAAGVGAPQAFARVHADENGRLHVRGPVAQGGAVATGDAGEVDADGRVHVHGRVDDLLNSGGAKIAPAEIEAALGAHPAVAEVAVVKAAHPRWGERPVAFVRLSAPASSAALRDHCRGRLPRHKCPEVIEIVTELPRVSTGKVDRRALASRAAEAVLALAEEPA
jgi:O-succinylbenzoic acid--CoA ligase